RRLAFLHSCFYLLLLAWLIKEAPSVWRNTCRSVHTGQGSLHLPETWGSSMRWPTALSPNWAGPLCITCRPIRPMVTRPQLLKFVSNWAGRPPALCLYRPARERISSASGKDLCFLKSWDLLTRCRVCSLCSRLELLLW